jgi:hypothetical protein
MKYFYLLVIVFLFPTCKTSKQAAKTDYVVIHFGSGGGVTNDVTTYSLYPDGKIWMSKSFSNDSSLVKEILHEHVKKLYIKVEESGVDTMQYQNPGNLYYFIHIRKHSGKNKIVWGDDNPPPTKEVEELYQDLLKIVKQ